jgi:glycosyltransferase involved in cell wall biosynthesis
VIYLYSDILGARGGIETYLHALAAKLHQDGIPFQIAVSENGRADFLDELSGLGIEVYRQPPVPGDRWHLRKRLLIRHVARRLKPGDWVYCVRQPMPELYLPLVSAVHRRGARIAASWMFAPEFLLPPERHAAAFRRAVAETDAVISVSRCTARQFREFYGYQGKVYVVRYHNAEHFSAPLPLPPSPPFRIGFMGRIDIRQKNLDTILKTFAELARRREDVELHIYGGGPDEAQLAELVAALGLGGKVVLHGPYDQRKDLEPIIRQCHLFIYTSRFEGGPCFSLLELLQAGRFVVTSPVGGIPDIYEGRPEIGTLVPSDDPDAIARALENALDRIASGAVDGDRIRARYDEEFTMDIAQREWLAALGMGHLGATHQRQMYRPSPSNNE